jgi:hypothetical protein
MLKELVLKNIGPTVKVLFTVLNSGIALTIVGFIYL